MDPAPSLPSSAARQVGSGGTAEVAVGVLTYNHADVIKRVLTAVAAGLEKYAARRPVALVASDAGSSDATVALIGEAALPVLLTQHAAPAGDRITVPYHGVPGRSAGFRLLLESARQLGARVLVVVEADAVSLEPEWIERLAQPVLDEAADLVTPIYARHRYDGTVTNLLIAPLVEALFGRRLRQPLGGQCAISARLAEHLVQHPGWDPGGRDPVDLWMEGTALAAGWPVWEAWLGIRTIESRTRTTDLPTVIAQTLGAAFGFMDRHTDLWLETRSGPPLPVTGTPSLPGAQPRDIGIERMVSAFRLGVKDLLPIWEHILGRDTLADVLSLDASEVDRFTFPDDLWARVVYDFAVGHHLAVLHRDHLLRSIVPLYLGRTAAFIISTFARDAAVTERALDAVGHAFARQKPYLVSQWTI